MGSLNKVLLIGNLGRDPEVRTTESGNCVCQLRMATHDWHRSKGENPETQTEWHNVVVFGRLAEIVKDYLKKGSKIFVEGRLRTRTFQKDNGNTQWYTEIIANDIRFLDSLHAASEETKASVDAAF